MCVCVCVYIYTHTYIENKDNTICFNKNIVYVSHLDKIGQYSIDLHYFGEALVLNPSSGDFKVSKNVFNIFFFVLYLMVSISADIQIQVSESDQNGKKWIVHVSALLVTMWTHGSKQYRSIGHLTNTQQAHESLFSHRWDSPVGLRSVTLHRVQGGLPIVAAAHVDVSVNHHCSHGAEDDNTCSYCTVSGSLYWSVLFSVLISTDQCIDWGIDLRWLFMLDTRVQVSVSGL